MLKLQELEKIVTKFNAGSTAAKEARVSVETPDGTMWDIKKIFLAQNKYNQTVNIRKQKSRTCFIVPEYPKPSKTNQNCFQKTSPLSNSAIRK